jgi:hypothetical protein
MAWCLINYVQGQFYLHLTLGVVLLVPNTLDHICTVDIFLGFLRPLKSQLMKSDSRVSCSDYSGIGLSRGRYSAGTAPICNYVSADVKRTGIASTCSVTSTSTILWHNNGSVISVHVSSDHNSTLSFVPHWNGEIVQAMFSTVWNVGINFRFVTSSGSFRVGKSYMHKTIRVTGFLRFVHCPEF